MPNLLSPSLRLATYFTYFKALIVLILTTEGVYNLLVVSTDMTTASGAALIIGIVVLLYLILTMVSIFLVRRQRPAGHVLLVVDTLVTLVALVYLLIIMFTGATTLSYPIAIVSGLLIVGDALTLIELVLSWPHPAQAIQQ